MGKPCPFSSFTIHNLIKTTIFKVMTLRDILVSDSENWPHSLILLFLLVNVCVCLAKLYRSCPIRDKGARSVAHPMELNWTESVLTWSALSPNQAHLSSLSICCAPYSTEACHWTNHFSTYWNLHLQWRHTSTIPCAPSCRHFVTAACLGICHAFRKLTSKN